MIAAVTKPKSMKELGMNSHGEGTSHARKPWQRPEVRQIKAGSAENGGNPTTNGDAPSSGAKS
jgi:hypothetical protein